MTSRFPGLPHSRRQIVLSTTVLHSTQHAGLRRWYTSPPVSQRFLVCAIHPYATVECRRYIHSKRDVMYMFFNALARPVSEALEAADGDVIDYFHNWAKREPSGPYVSSAPRSQYTPDYVLIDGPDHIQRHHGARRRRRRPRRYCAQVQLADAFGRLRSANHRLGRGETPFTLCLRSRMWSCISWSQNAPSMRSGAGVISLAMLMKCNRRDSRAAQ
ncbi:hypothetical protein B0H21DRAFT_757003 [Amylocystis lapponica]|nr:hypothetical protein B0H21DRAFT_757003 [Amylocystis lapponica]